MKHYKYDLIGADLDYGIKKTSSSANEKLGHKNH